MSLSPPTARSECQLVERYLTGLAHQSVQTGLSPFFALADLHAHRVAKSSGQAKRQHIHLTLHYLLEGLRQ